MRNCAVPLAVLITGCSSSTPPPANLAQVCGVSAADAGQVADVETGNAAFGVALFGGLAAAGGNLVLSPYSVSSALDLAYAGAATTTAAQMAQVLGLGSASSNPGPAVANIACEAESDGSADGNQLAIGNALFGQKTLTFESAFLSTLSTDYGAPLQPVDFEAASAAAVATINGWVAGETANMIPVLLRPGDIGPATRLVLVNALYFKGAWQNGFDPGQTHTGTFNTSATTQVSAALMSLSSAGPFGFFENSQLSIAELPYKGGKIAFDILLPSDPEGLAGLISGLTASQLQGWLSQLQPVAFGSLEVPKLKLDSHVELAGPLQTLGLILPFDPQQADFSGMDGAHDLSIQTVVHEAVIEVDETGATAAAATAVGVSAETIAGSHSPALSFIADHPFLFVLRDLGTGTVLFIGAVTDPTQG